MGVIEIEHFLKHLAAKDHGEGKINMNTARNFLQEADLDGDGRVSKEEFYRFYKH